jgi:8-oxo-dGTP pyrophosphatase MutT (NUDIX family)
MAGILRGEGDWEAAIADSLRSARRPIRISPRFMPRGARGAPGVQGSTARLASTLLLVYPGPTGELTIPLTVRHADLRTHAGEVSLPGGAVDAADRTRAATAVREAGEEIGLDATGVRVLGALDDIWIPVSNYRVRPFVAAVAERPALVPHDAEVSAIIELPVRLLLDEGLVRDEVIELPGLRLRAGVYRHDGVRIWGATARTLAMLSTVLLEAELDR